MLCPIFSSRPASHLYLFHFYLSVIRSKGESQNGCFKKTKHVKFFEKQIFFTPLIRTRRGLKSVRFLENLTCFVFLERTLTLLPTYWEMLRCPENSDKNEETKILFDLCSKPNCVYWYITNYFVNPYWE